MKDVGTDKMNDIQERLQQVVTKEFPSERYAVSFTGKALVFLKGTNYLISNLSLFTVFSNFFNSIIYGLDV